VNLRIIAVTVGLIGSASICFGQQSPFIAYTTQDGLAQSQIRAIQQDHQGYLWVGSLGGLSRFDGISFVNYSSQDGLISNKVNCLHLGNKHLWVGTTGGISKLEGTSLKPISLPDRFVRSEVLDIVESSNGALWIALNGDGLLRYEDDKFHAYGTDEGLIDLFIRSIEIDPIGNLWVGSKSGVTTYDGKTFSSPTKFKSLSVSDLHRLTTGEMLICTFGNGVIRVNASDTTQYLAEQGLESNHIRYAVELNKDEIWLGSRKGLVRWRKDGFKFYNENQGLTYSNIKSLGKDREGNLWIGTDGNGLLLKAGNAFSHYDTRDGLLSNLVLSIANIGNDTLMIGTYTNGIQLFQKGNFHPYSSNELFANQRVWSIVQGADQRIWIGSSMGLYCDNSALGGSVNQLLANTEVTALALIDSNIAVGSDSGLRIFDPNGNQIDSTVFCGDLKIRNVRSLLVREETVWMAAQGYVIAKSPTDCRFYPIDLKEETAVYTLVADRSGMIWAGTSDGLYLIDPQAGSVDEIFFSKEISARNINFLWWLKPDVLLAGTNNGLYKLSDYDPGNSEKLEVRQYGPFEGLRSAETNQNALYAEGDSIWFGTTTGLVCFAANKASNSEIPPILRISGVQLFARATDWTAFPNNGFDERELPIDPVLPYKQNALTFNFTGIHFSNPEKISYRYLMEGIEQTWIGPTKEQSVTYAYLPHGSYTFRVEAYHEEWPDAIAESSFQFSIKPPFYLTWWFYCIVILAVVAAIYTIYKSQINRERKKQAAEKLMIQSRMIELESLALNSSMNRHFIFNALNSIQYYINAQDKRSANKYLSSFARLIRKNLDSSQQNQTSLQDELDRVALYLSLEEMRFQGRFAYEVEVDPTIVTRDVQIPSMMLQPYLENSIWHGVLPSEKAGRIDLKIGRDKEDITIQISDNGIGIDTSMRNKKDDNNGHDSKGMILTKNRIELFRRMTGQNYVVQGPFELTDDTGQILGTRVNIRIPQQTSTTVKENSEKVW